MTDEQVAALTTDRTIDITTLGKRSGRPSRIEIWFHNIDGHIYITGLPGTRDWYANLLAEPRFTFHLKESVAADLDAVAHPVTDPETRRAVFEVLLPRLGHSDRMDAWLESSPLVEVTFL